VGPLYGFVEALCGFVEALCGFVGPLNDFAEARNNFAEARNNFVGALNGFVEAPERAKGTHFSPCLTRTTTSLSKCPPVLRPRRRRPALIRSKPPGPAKQVRSDPALASL
jgi:hypothetical protein